MGYGAEREETLRSALEPESHNEVYAWLRKMLVSPVYRAVGRSLNFIVVRGGSERLTLILNFFHLDAAVMHKTKLLADHVRAELPRVAAMFTFLDETRSEFYLESRSAGASVQEALRLRVSRPHRRRLQVPVPAVRVLPGQ